MPANDTLLWYWAPALGTTNNFKPDIGSADFSGEQDKLGEDFHESKEEVFGVCNASKVGTK
jgi:hypothetical protein